MKRTNKMRKELDERVRFGTRLRSLRTRFNLTQEDVARHIGASSAQISTWENGNFEPGVYYTILIANYFGITVGQLLGVEPITNEQYFKMWVLFT